MVFMIFKYDVLQNAAHHSGKNDKESVVVHWKAPKEYNGQVTFTATFVQGKF